jgi:hypothetical protein
MTELRYDIQMSGPYAAVRAVLASLDAPGGKVALRSIQIAASQDLEASSTDSTGLGSTPRRIVTATAGLSAYVATDQDMVAGPEGRMRVPVRTHQASAVREVKHGDS